MNEVNNIPILNIKYSETDEWIPIPAIKGTSVGVEIASTSSLGRNGTIVKFTDEKKQIEDSSYTGDIFTIWDGLNGTGSVNTVDQESPDNEHNVSLSAVRYVTQDLDDEQKTQARINIGALAVNASSTADPIMNGTASPGSSNSWARGDHIHPTDTSRASVAELATYIRPNLLDNWYFVGGGSQLSYGTFPINQQRQTAYTTAGNCIDRWVLNTGSFNVNASGLVRTNCDMHQNVNSSPFLGKTVTFSVLTSERLFVMTATVPATDPNEWQVIGSSDGLRLAFEGNNKGIRCQIFASVSGTVLAAKLEVGSTQTLAHQENSTWVLNEIPNYTEQLLRCQQPTSTIATNRNLLNNWYFVGGGSQLGTGIFPLNRNGATSYSGSTLTIDRWRIAGSLSLTVSSDCISFSSGQTNSYQDFYQNLLQDLPAGTYTLSMLANVTSIGGTVWFCMRDERHYVQHAVLLTAGSGYRLFSTTFILDSTAHNWSVSLVTDQAATNYINVDMKAWKLEVGSKQTLAHEENGTWVLNEIPDWQKQYYECAVAETSGILKTSANGTISAAVAGTDYLTPATNYSPVRYIMATPYNISTADIGATVCCGYGIRNTPITVNLTQAVSTTLPIGTEIAILNYFDSDITIAVSGIQVGVSGIDGGGPTKLFYSSTSHSFKPGDIYSMLALKKISSDATYGDCWLLTGNVEVVS